MKNQTITLMTLQLASICLFLFLTTATCYGTDDDSFLLFYSNNVYGETDPCG